MSISGDVLRFGDVDARLGDAWDAMPESRGVQADIYDSWAWHVAAAESDAGLRSAMVIPAVLRDGAPVALLALTRMPSGTWRNVGTRSRPRRRVVVRSEHPDEEALLVLAELVARRSRALQLHKMPSRDPATAAFLSALRQVGFAVEVREASADRLAPVSGDWAAHTREFRGFAKYATRFATRASHLWDLSMDTYGTSPEFPVSSGFETFLGLQERSWKGPMPAATANLRRRLLSRSERNGWARVFILNVAGRPAAGHVWFRLGDVATWMSTCHDRALDSLSPGTIVQWWSQERIFDDPRGAPRLLDFLPGGTDQKDRLSPDRPPLLEVDAVRRSVTAGVELPARRLLGRAGPGLAARRTVLSQRLARGRVPRRPTQPAARLVYIPAPARATWHAKALDIEDPLVRRCVVAACGATGADALTKASEPGDRWWTVGHEPVVALVRTSADDTAREVVEFETAPDLRDILEAVVSARGRQLRVWVADRTGNRGTTPLSVRRATLPWPER